MDAPEAQDRSLSEKVEYDPRQLDIDRNRNDQRLKSRLEDIFSKYEHNFEGVGDEIEISTGKIVVNNGHIQHMQHEADPGKSASSLFAHAFQEELEHEDESGEDDEADDAQAGVEEERGRYRDEPLHSSGIEDMPTLTSRPPELPVNLGLKDTERPVPRLARLIAGDNTPQRAGTQSDVAQVPDAPSSAMTMSGLATPLLARVPGLCQSLRDAQPGTRRRSVAPEVVKKLGVSIANQLAQYMPGNGQKKKKANESRLSLPAGVSDPVWAYPELPASVAQKRQRPSSPARSKAGSSPAPDAVGQHSLWTAEGVVRPRKRRRSKMEIADGAPATALPLLIRPLSSAKPTQNVDLRRCWNCSLTRTSAWQKGPHGQDLCMSCGTYFERYRRMKPFDSPTPEPEERVTKHVETTANRIDDHDAYEAHPDHESEEPLHHIQDGHGEVITQSSPSGLRREGEDTRSLPAQPHHNSDLPMRGAAPVLEAESAHVEVVARAPGPKIIAATQNKPIAFVMLQKRAAKDVREGETLTSQQPRPRIMNEGLDVEVHEHQRVDSIDDYVNDFEVTPAGQLERRLNPLLHHGAPAPDEQLAGTSTMPSAVKTPVLDSSAPTTPTSTGYGMSEQHDDASVHDVSHTTLWKNPAWNNSQDELLLELREEQDLEWEDISGLLPGHSPEDVERRYELLIDAAAHTMRISSQISAPESVSSLPPGLSTTHGASAKDDLDVRSSKHQLLQTPDIDVVLPANSDSSSITDNNHTQSSKHRLLQTPEIDGASPVNSEVNLATASGPAEAFPSDSAAISSKAGSVHRFSSPANDYSPLPDYRCDSEDAVDTTTHVTPPSNTTIHRQRSEATPSADDRQDFALINEVFDSLELADPSRQLFREMGDSPRPAPALGDLGYATNAPPTVQSVAHVEQTTASNISKLPAIRSPYRTRKRLSDQSARDSVVEPEDLSSCSQFLDPPGDNSSTGEQRPRLTYVQLVEAAFIAHGCRPLRVVDVFTWVRQKYSWFRELKDSPLRNSIRSTLSAHRQFERVKTADGKKAWRLKRSKSISAKIRSRRKSRRTTIGTVSQLIEEEDELATPKTTSMRKSLLRKPSSPRMSTPAPIFVQSTRTIAKRRSSGRNFLDVGTGRPVREVDPGEDELAVM